MSDVCKPRQKNNRTYELIHSVPISRLPDLVRDTKKDFDENGIISPIIGHVGDGNFHCMFTFRNDSELEVVNAASARLVKRALELDGTCKLELSMTFKVTHHVDL